MFHLRPTFFILAIISFFLSPTFAIRSFPETNTSPEFTQAPEYRNGPECALLSTTNLKSPCHPSLIHIATTLDSHYLRGSIAAIHSLLKHTSCPENIYFHFIATSKKNPLELTQIVQSTFPSLNFKVYLFEESLVNNLISSSIRQALDNPLNYARNYLAKMLNPCIRRLIYLDSDIIVVDDIQNLWKIPLTGSRTIGAPEYCQANFTRYFTNQFWSDPEFSKVFSGKRPCYFNTGVMVMDLERWRKGDFTRKIEEWMEIQKENRIYELGSLPPFLLMFGGDVESIDHRWNQHGLGGDNVTGRCRDLHPGPVSVLHWSGKGKPWKRLDEGRACPVDQLWAPYDLYNRQSKR